MIGGQALISYNRRIKGLEADLSCDWRTGINQLQLDCKQREVKYSCDWRTGINQLQYKNLL